MHFLLIFDLKTIIFPLDDAKLSKSWRKIWFIYFFNYFWCYLKKRERGSDKYENWLVEQFDRAKKKISK